MWSLVDFNLLRVGFQNSTWMSDAPRCYLCYLDDLQKNNSDTSTSSHHQKVNGVLLTSNSEGFFCMGLELDIAKWGNLCLTCNCLESRFYKTTTVSAVCRHSHCCLFLANDASWVRGVLHKQYETHSHRLHRVCTKCAATVISILLITRMFVKLLRLV